MSAPTAPRRHRVGKPKVRTGCATCKQRRVKCDETRPQCIRCTNAGFPCAGYPGIEPRANAAGRQVSLHQGRGRKAMHAICPRPSPVEALDCLISTLGYMSLSKEDVPYFDLFRHQVARDLSGHIYSNFWGNVVPREATRDDCVKHAILALGALSKAMFFTSDATNLEDGVSPRAIRAPRHPDKQQLSNLHFAAAFRYHNRALSEYRTRLRDRTDPNWPRLALIMTLLLLAFEFMQGNISAVDGIIKSGILMLNTSLSNMELETRHSYRECYQDLQETMHLLPCVSLLSVYTYFCKAQHLDLEPPRIPSGCDPRSMNELVGLWGSTYQKCMSFITRVMDPNYRNRQFAVVEEAQNNLLRSLRQWKEVLDTYEREVVGDPDRKLGLDLIVIQHIVFTVLVSCCTDNTDLVFDSFGAEFLEIVDRCAIFLDLQGSVPRIPFVFNGGNLTSALSLVVSKCRHQQTRKRAIDLFRRISWRDGSWDRRSIMCKIGGAELEEKGRDENGYIPPSSRWMCTAMEWEHPSGHTLAEYTRSLPDENGFPVKTWILHSDT